MKVTLLTGGVGGSKLALGFYNAKNCELTAIANTGDDIEMHGLHVSPDPDILLYTLAAQVNPATGWGIRDDTFHVAKALAVYGRETWFQLGDRDLATHVHRTAMMKSGATLSQSIESVRRSLGVSARVLPMSDDPVATILRTGEGEMHLQEYLVKRRCQPEVRGIEFRGISTAGAAPGVTETISDAELIVIAPSNPLISIGPIIGITAIREALRARRDSVVAVSPLVGGKSLKGPTDRMMAELGYQVSSSTVATLYRDFCGSIVLDRSDDSERAAIQDIGVAPILLPSVMRTLADKIALAEALLARFRESR